MTKSVDHEKLRHVVAAICEAAGARGEVPAKVANNLVMANLKGHDSHGVGMLPRYIQCVHTGTLQPNANAEIVQDSGALIVVDGRSGFGQVIGEQAMDFGIARAREHGVAVVATRNSFHLCRIGAWAEQCCDAGFVSMHHVNVIGHSPIVAPHGGAEGRYATNPYTVGIPATGKHPPVVLDMATSIVALGKVRVAKNKGEQVAEGILLDPEGNPTTDPNVMYAKPRGAVKPFGGHKGGGLAVINEILAGALTGGHTMRPETTPKVDTVINGMLSVIIDPGRLVDVEGFFKPELDATIEWIRSARPLDPAQPVLLPGDPERATLAEREAHGVPIDDTTWGEILAAGESCGLDRAQLEQLAG